MKKQLMISMFILLGDCIYHPDTGNKEIDIEFNIIEKLDLKKTNAFEGSFYSISIDLINNTDSFIRFWIMTCSWQENFIFNNKNLYLYLEGCDNNIPQIIQVEGKNKVSFFGVIRVIGSVEKLKKSNLKLGFIFIEDKEIQDLSGFRKVLNNKLDKGDVIWTEAYKINL